MIDYAPARVNQELTTDNFAHFETVDEAHENGFTKHITVSNELEKRITETQTAIQLLHERHGELALVRREDTSYHDVLARTPEVVRVPTAKESVVRRMARTVFGR